MGMRCRSVQKEKRVSEQNSILKVTPVVSHSLLTLDIVRSINTFPEVVVVHLPAQVNSHDSFSAVMVKVTVDVCSTELACRPIPEGSRKHALQ